MVRRFVPSVAALAVLAASGCATTSSSQGYQAPIHMQVPEFVAWEPAGPYELKLTVFNGGAMTIEIVGMKPEAAQVKLLRADGSVACKTPNAARKTYDIWWTRKLKDATGMDLKLDLRDACKDLKPGVYRYEAVYVSNNVAGAMGSLYQGTFGPETGRVLVREGATKLGAEELRAALEEPQAAPAQAAVEPAKAPAPASAEPAPAAQPAAAAPATPAAAPAPAASADTDAPALSPKEVRACVDRELAARGLNAYGDPKGTVYDGGAPVDEFGRILYVASRNPAIRKTCGIPKF